MNIQEYVASISTKCIPYGPARKKAGSPSNPEPEIWVIPILELGQQGTWKEGTNHHFQVMNVGKVAGPQTYEADVLAEDGVTVLHAAGDPKLDENGVQIVLSEQEAEYVYAKETILNPIDDTMTAIGYLEAQKDAGTWLRYVEDDQGPKRPDLKFFTIKAFVPEASGVREQRFLIAYDDAGNPFHEPIA